MSKISKVFDFDRELFISKVYERALQNSLRDTVKNLRQQQPQIKEPQIKRPRLVPTAKEIGRSQMIDRELERDSQKLRREAKVLLLGDPECGHAVVEQMKIIHQNGYTTDERALYKLTIKKDVLRIMKIMVSIVDMVGTELDETAKAYAELLSKEIQKSQPGAANIVLTAETAKAVYGLWTSEKFQSICSENTDINIPDNAF
jgi:guanine nucleotide-binding protein subunit alpha